MVGISYEADEKLQKALLDMPVESECGLSCKGAIDAARALLTHVENATGHDYPERNEAVVKVMLHVVATYIFG
jgi:hypothetical protein